MRMTARLFRYALLSLAIIYLLTYAELLPIRAVYEQY